jgi:predicted RNA binding protein YcfA (HicA-like mRNA interferase family)
MKSVNGNEVMRALTIIGFVFVKQKGSHVKLRRITPDGKRTVIVPLHKDLPEGTLHSISRQADLTFEEFKKLFEN